MPVENPLGTATQPPDPTEPGLVSGSLGAAKCRVFKYKPAGDEVAKSVVLAHGMTGPFVQIVAVYKPTAEAAWENLPFAAASAVYSEGTATIELSKTVKALGLCVFLVIGS